MKRWRTDSRAAQALLERRVAGNLDGGRAGPLNVAEVDCGAGGVCHWWAGRGHRVFGVDRGAGPIALARRLAQAARLDIVFDHASALALPWPGRSMDLCRLRLAPAGEWRLQLAEAVRVVRPGGALHISSAAGALPAQMAAELARHGLQLGGTGASVLPSWLLRKAGAPATLLAFKPCMGDPGAGRDRLTPDSHIAGLAGRPVDGCGNTSAGGAGSR